MKIKEPVDMPLRVDQVLPNLYIGPMAGRLDVPRLEIKHVISLRSSPFTSYPLCKKTVTEHYYSLGDSSDAVLKPVLDDCLPKIHAARIANENVLVHCRAGVSRSASIIIAYLMKYENMDYNTALEHLRKMRPCINPNYGFRRQLRKFEKKIKTMPTIEESNDAIVHQPMV